MVFFEPVLFVPYIFVIWNRSALLIEVVDIPLGVVIIGGDFGLYLWDYADILYGVGDDGIQFGHASLNAGFEILFEICMFQDSVGIFDNPDDFLENVDNAVIDLFFIGREQ